MPQMIERMIEPRIRCPDIGQTAENSRGSPRRSSVGERAEPLRAKIAFDATI